MQFETAEASAFHAEWRKKQAIKNQKFIEETGYMTIEQIWEATERNVTKSRTCSKCGMVCKTVTHLANHRGSENCRKRQAEQEGKPFVPKRKTYRHCEICDASVLHYNWKGHIESQSHIKKEEASKEPEFECKICNKVFEKGPARRTMLKKHLNGPRHRKKAILPNNRYIHNACCRKHNFNLAPLPKRSIKVV